ncbi:hypothetical protein COY00_03090 [Candidatus Pacearchaeota archaeon CG_4_10_14_0_2_um_filter_35_33]|nr:glycosyltransferase family 2 protein [Candidatus Pacearchaeota archaeon]OIO42247.1 MAG: hypothetical protein AUJ63_03125 [Candidatus Pacearchaeota archaeon CG1_02_35_32]PIY81334.1 MAG: hypothetical protein COY79_03590 [Candidatus Pacearchaeota archaeon CG_4_10_14_0_8_um_filter_35_169]PIZ79788.1 MAG: hypothetical protein COY00_03090 [Candidatus Pacearchaeota archaeon CG_4_10_14_0_2_um_filter_35_33]PJA69478.1 MAG: hypothetical protein CO155_04340 [Candidatus Pacearchaeota archaeon CG_4_9_14_3_
MAASVSVIVPFYGTSQIQRLELVAKSILSQEGVNVDFVVAGLDNTPRISHISDLLKHPRESIPNIVRTGGIINNRLRLAKGEFIYVTDADVLLPNQHYLERLVQESVANEVSLKRPPMRRLLIQDFDWFYSEVSLKGLENSVASLDNSQEYIVKPRETEKPTRIFPKFESGRQKVFIASESDFQKYVSDERNRGLEPQYFNQDRHCGAVFATKDSIERIGGYHERFISWGVWDADIQWKLENQTGMKLIPNREEFTVIHLDHEKGYFSKPKWEHDKKLQEKRRALGFEKCVEKDKRAYLGEENDK